MAGLPWPTGAIGWLTFGTTLYALFVVWFWFCTRFPLGGVFVTSVLFGLFGGRRRW